MTDHSRRLFLATTAGVAAGAVAGTFLRPELLLSQGTPNELLAEQNSFYGTHQNGIELKQQALTVFIGMDLSEGLTKEAFGRWMRIITEDSERLTKGVSPLADPQPELAMASAGLTVTVGFGPKLFEKLGLQAKKPVHFEDLPSFKIDALRPEFTGGDVLLHLSAHDPMVLTHAARQLIRASSNFAKVRWQQQGFSGTRDPSLETPRSRNLMGQIEGSGNPEIGTSEFARSVWVQNGPTWIQGGTFLVLRRIVMDLDSWDKLPRVAKEQAIGRNLKNGAPLGMTKESDPLGLGSINSQIETDAHVRRASPTKPSRRIFRRGFNFATDLDATGKQEFGLLFAAYQASIADQFLPIQKRLESMDSLNSWTTPIGSAVFALPKGVSQGEVIGQELFS